MPSGFSQEDFTISVFQPMQRGGDFLQSLTVPIANWTHTNSAYGGYNLASFRLAVGQDGQEDWLENGLGRSIVAYDEAGDEFWSGFVDRITLSKAGLEVVRGPLVDIATRVAAVYSTVDTSTTPPTLGIRATTPEVMDLTAEREYGVWSKLLSLAGVTDDNAEQIRDQYLVEHRLPETSSNYNYGGQSIAINVECRGWIHSLQYPYSQRSVGGLIDLDAQIRAILAADPNGWVNPDPRRIVENTTQVSRWDSSYGKALDTIKGLVAMGDSTNRRYVFGVYEDRLPVYLPASQEPDYEVRLSDPYRRIQLIGGGEVMPWQIRPGKWVFFSDFLPGRPQHSADLHEDPRMLFIESVVFDLASGYAYELVGGKVSALSQKMERLGLGGISA